MPIPRFLPALPAPHFMAFAPLDAWWRTLRAPGGIPPRYWLRLVWCLFTSTLGTLITLPERLLLWPALRILRGRADRAPQASPAPATAPQLLCILGYYRSGTTHLHYLLSCDPRFVTPRWYQVLAPSGFILSWTLMRWLLVPFLSSSRPQDDVSFGPEWPSEDDFAVCNWTGACTMPGRMVLPAPASWAHFRRFQTLEGLTERERACFTRPLRAFVRKLQLLSRGKTVLLKSPPHTARLAELVRLFGERAGGVGGVRFIHLSREPVPVLRSNVAMHRRFAPFFLQDHPGEDVIRTRVIDEYDRTERAFLRDLEQLPGGGKGMVSFIRYQDLVADPLAQLRRAYAELGIDFTPEFQRRAANYIAGVADYRVAADKPKSEKPATDREYPLGDDSSVPPELAWMRERFGHTRPALPQASMQAAAPVTTRTPFSWPTAAGIVAACAAATLWLLAAFFARDRMDWLVWPTGALIGIAAVRVARIGSPRLGLLTAALTLAVLLLVAVPATLFTSDYRHQLAPAARIPWDHVALSVRRGLAAENNLVWIILGTMTAYRIASRKHIRPPGME